MNQANPNCTLLRRIRWLTWIFILGLVFSGATAIPLESEIEWLVRWSGAEAASGNSESNSWWAAWLIKVRQALNETNTRYPFLAYGTDWLAFGHFVIAIAFIGLLRDPVRNRWLVDFGLIACALVVPYALVFGAMRGIPAGWRLVDCAFGVFGAIPLWAIKRLIRQLEMNDSVPTLSKFTQP